MLGLGILSGVLNSGSAATRGAAFNGTFPHEGSYIYMTSEFVVTEEVAAGPVVLNSPSDISFDDAFHEGWSFEGSDWSVYDDSGVGNSYDTADPHYGVSGDTFTITGHVTKANGEVWDGDDTGSNGYVFFEFNSSDIGYVYIDLQNNSSITADNYDKVSSTGAFSVSVTLTGTFNRFKIRATAINHDDGVQDPGVPGVRLFNLKMTKN
tara:strand:+ start:438 stop:1061 length:624 start_codon:yes stop_codon:yes gene_type:complete